MARVKAPIPKNQQELSQDKITPYTTEGKVPLPDIKKRGIQRRVDKDTTKPLSVGLKDIDEAIHYYFNNIIRPSVISNGQRINVPIVYGNPERWTAVQRDGFYRDKNGKIQTPLLMFKRDSVEKNRSLGSKIDANFPVNYGVFEKKYSKSNIYDNFSVLTNREPIREFYGIVFPDYVNITYSCILFTDYVEQMNKLIESINYASDSYWGDPQRFKFKANIDTYQTVVELNKGSDRAVKTTFNISLLGHIIPDSINANLVGSNKYFSKSRVVFKLETSDSIETLTARAGTPEKAAATRFFDTPIGTGASSLSLEQILYNEKSNVFIADIVTLNTATFTGRSFIVPPSGFIIDQSSFSVYVNGILVPEFARNVAEVGGDVVVTFDQNLLGYPIETEDQIILVGKVQ